MGSINDLQKMQHKNIIREVDNRKAKKCLGHNTVVFPIYIFYIYYYENYSHFNLILDNISIYFTFFNTLYMNIYDISVKKPNGETVSLSDYQ
jgi:hypothetical protein